MIQGVCYPRLRNTKALQTVLQTLQRLKIALNNSEKGTNPESQWMKYFKKNTKNCLTNNVVYCSIVKHLKSAFHSRPRATAAWESSPCLAWHKYGMEHRKTIVKWRKYGAIVTLPTTGHPSSIDEKTDNVAKRVTATLKELWGISGNEHHTSQQKSYSAASEHHQ